jgi:nitrogen fixation protein FixH
MVIDLKKQSKRAWLWPVGIACALAIHTGGMLLAVTIASSDKSFRVDPDYYRRGFNWDEKKHLHQQSQKLGWQVWLSGDTKVVSIRLRDSAGAGIENAKVLATFFHDARAKQTQTIELSPDGEAGMYRAPVSLTRPGFYTFDLDITAGQKRYVDTKTLWINP